MPGFPPPAPRPAEATTVSVPGPAAKAHPPRQSRCKQPGRPRAPPAVLACRWRQDPAVAARCAIAAPVARPAANVSARAPPRSDRRWPAGRTARPAGGAPGRTPVPAGDRPPRRRAAGWTARPGPAAPEQPGQIRRVAPDAARAAASPADPAAPGRRTPRPPRAAATMPARSVRTAAPPARWRGATAGGATGPRYPVLDCRLSGSSDVHHLSQSGTISAAHRSSSL